MEQTASPTSRQPEFPVVAAAVDMWPAFLSALSTGSGLRRTRRTARLCPRCALQSPGGEDYETFDDAGKDSNHTREARQARAQRLDAEFRALQEEYSDVPNLHIFNADEYELDPRGVPWLQDMRGRDREKLKQALGGRPAPPGFDDAPLLHTDLFDQSELDGMVESFQSIDPRGNRLWIDPMPASDFDHAAAWAAGLYDEKEGGDGIEARSDAPVEGSPLYERDHIPADEQAIRPEDRVHFRPFPARNPTEDNAADDLDLSQSADVGIVYSSLAEERNALLETYAKEDTRLMVENEAGLAKAFDSDATIPVPEREEYSRWQREALKRGGNASVGDSHSLSPAKLASENDVASGRRREMGYHKMTATIAVPAQHGTLTEVHGGQWTGIATVISISTILRNGEDIDPEGVPSTSGRGGFDGGGEHAAGKEGDEGDRRENVEIANASLQSDARISGTKEVPNELTSVLGKPRADRSVQILTSVVDHVDGESTLWSLDVAGSPERSSSPQCRIGNGDVLTPGLAVFADGSYVAQAASGSESLDDTENDCGVPDGGLSISDECLSSLIGMDSERIGCVSGVAELCVVENNSGGTKRHRAVLCTVGEQLSYVLSIAEVQGTGSAAELAAAEFASQIANIQDVLVGIWRGHGTSLHPHFPPFPISDMTSLNEFECLRSAPPPQDMTYLKEDFSSAPAAVSTRAPRSAGRPEESGGRTKLSKRVVAALKHDARRLSRCRFVGTDILQEAVKERHAWEMLRSALRSPRLGPHAPDYVTIPLPGGSLLSMALGKWNPQMRNRVELLVATEAGGGNDVGDVACRQRTRLIAARSPDGVITGAGLLLEKADVGGPSTAVVPEE